MVGGVPLGPGDKVAGAELPLPLLLDKGVKLPVDPDDLGRKLFRNALKDHGVGLGGGRQAVLRHLDDGVDAHMHGLGGTILVADNGLEGLHVALRVPAVGQLAAVGDVRVLQQLAHALKIAGVNEPAVGIQQISDLEYILYRHGELPFIEKMQDPLILLTTVLLYKFFRMMSIQAKAFLCIAQL